jgi:hypothetical protein
LRSRGCTLLSQTGSHCFYLTPLGTTAPCPDPGSGHPVTTLVAKEAAAALGLGITELRTELGYAPHSRPTKTQTKTKAAPEYTAAVPPARKVAAEILKMAAQIAKSGKANIASDHKRAELVGIASKLRSWMKEAA